MGFVPRSDTAEVDINMILLGQIVQLTLYFITGGELDEAALTDLANAVMGWFVSTLLTHLSYQVTLRDVRATSLASASAPSVNVAPSTTTAGGESAEASPNNVSVAVQFDTSGRGRSSRGRNFLPGLPSNKVVDSAIISGYADQVLADYAALAAALEPTVFSHHVVYSRRNGGVDRTEGVAQPVITYKFADLNVDSQRRRLIGRGR